MSPERPPSAAKPEGPVETKDSFSRIRSLLHDLRAPVHTLALECELLRQSLRETTVPDASARAEQLAGAETMQGEVARVGRLLDELQGELARAGSRGAGS